MWLPSLLTLFLGSCVDLSPVQSPDWSLGHGMRCYHGYCHTEAKGFVTKSVLQLPEIELPPNMKDLKFVIPDKCLEWRRELAGSVVHACDYDTTPALRLKDDGTGPAMVRRRGKLRVPAKVYMKQYCV